MKFVSKYITYLAILLLIASSLPLQVYAGNSSYIALSNQMARKHQLLLLTHNAANANNIGFEEENIMLREANFKNDKYRKNSFVYAVSSYKSGEIGALKVTGKPMDLAIIGEGYFKVATPNGVRYTLNGEMILNKNGTIINHNGYPLLSSSGSVIQFNEDYKHFDITKDGVIFVDNEELAEIGVFKCTDSQQMLREGQNLFTCNAEDLLVKDRQIISGALRTSNVNPTRTMAEMVDMQRSFDTSASLMSDINRLEKTIITRLGGVR